MEKNNQREKLKDNLNVFVVPVEIMDVPGLDIYEQMVYIVLRSYANARESTAFPSYKTIAEAGRMSRRKAIDAVASLTDKGLLKKEMQGKYDPKTKSYRHTSNLYTIERPSAYRSPSSAQDALGSAQRAPIASAQDALGSAQRAPKHNHLTKSIRTNVINNNREEENTPVDDDCSVHAFICSKNLSVSKDVLSRLKEKASNEIIIKAVNIAVRKAKSNPIGYVIKMINEGYDGEEVIIEHKKEEKQDLPEWVVRQLEGQNNTSNGEIDETKKKEALKLLKALGEID